MRVRILGRAPAALVGPRRRLLEKRELRLFRLLDVVGVDRLRLDRGIDAGASGRSAGFDRPLELAGMIVAPGILDGGVLGKRLAVTAVKALPVFFERRAVVGIGLVSVREFQPLLRHAAPLQQSCYR